MKLKDAAFIVYGALQCSECSKYFTPCPDCRVSQNESVAGHLCPSCYASLRQEWLEKHATSYSDLPEEEEESGEDLTWADEIGDDDEQ